MTLSLASVTLVSAIRDEYDDASRFDIPDPPFVIVHSLDNGDELLDAIEADEAGVYYALTFASQNGTTLRNGPDLFGVFDRLPEPLDRSLGVIVGAVPQKEPAGIYQSRLLLRVPVEYRKGLVPMVGMVRGEVVPLWIPLPIKCFVREVMKDGRFSRVSLKCTGAPERAGYRVAVEL